MAGLNSPGSVFFCASTTWSTFSFSSLNWFVVTAVDGAGAAVPAVDSSIHRVFLSAPQFVGVVHLSFFKIVLHLSQLLFQLLHFICLLGLSDGYAQAKGGDSPKKVFSFIFLLQTLKRHDRA